MGFPPSTIVYYPINVQRNYGFTAFFGFKELKR